MLARFVQVTPDELALLQTSPSAIADLLDEADELSGPLVLSGEARRRMEANAPQVLSRVLTGVDPALQDALAERLGVDRDALGTEAGSAAIFQLMQRRGLLGDESGEDTDSKPGSPHSTLSLDKAWHGVHYLLCGQPEPTEGTLGSVILGGTELGDDDFGYGPARCFDATEVDGIAAELGRDALEDEVVGRYEPEPMTSLGIYPGGWESSDGEWLFEAFRELRDFFQEAAARGSAVVTCLV